MFERFTEQARQVVVLAQEEARELCHDYIGTEHLLGGLLREEESLAAGLLRDCGVELERCRRQIVEVIGSGEERPGGQIPFTPRARKVLELSVKASSRLGHNYVGCEHLLLGLLDEGEGVAMRVLLDLHVDPEELREELAVRTGAPPAPPSEDFEEYTRRRLATVEAILAAHARRDEVARVIGDAADVSAAVASVAELLDVPAEPAARLVAMRLQRWTRAEIAELERERRALHRELGG